MLIKYPTAIVVYFFSDTKLLKLIRSELDLDLRISIHRYIATHVGVRSHIANEDQTKGTTCTTCPGRILDLATQRTMDNAQPWTRGGRVFPEAPSATSAPMEKAPRCS